VRCPTIVISARLEGHDAVRRVLVDGADQGMTDGRPIRVNPGRHTIVVRDEVSGAERLEAIIVREGEHERVVTIAEADPRPCLSPEREPPGARGCGCEMPGARPRRGD
jgi:hypothetical protein